MKKGDLIRNKYDGKFAIVLTTYTRFFQDDNAMHYDYDYGSAGTAVEIKWMECGSKRTLRKSKMKRNWEIVSCK